MIQLIMILLEIKDLGSLRFLVNPAVTWTFFNIVSEADRRDISTVIWNEFIAKFHFMTGYDIVM